MAEDLSRYYRLLDLEPGASPEAVKEAYRDLAYVWHPDRFSGDERRQQKATEKLKEINAAYQKLRSAERELQPRGCSGGTPSGPSETRQRSRGSSAAEPRRRATDSSDLSDEQDELRRAAEEWQRSAWREDPARHAEKARRTREEEISRLAAEQEQREREQVRQAELRRLGNSRRDLASGLLGAGLLLGITITSALHLSGAIGLLAFTLSAAVPPAAGARELLRQSDAIRALRGELEAL